MKNRSMSFLAVLKCVVHPSGTASNARNPDMEASIGLFGQSDLTPQAWVALLTDLRAKEKAMLEAVVGLVDPVAAGTPIAFSTAAQVMTDSGDFTLANIADDRTLARELGSSNLRIWTLEVDAACGGDTGMTFRVMSFTPSWTVSVRGGNCMVRKRTFSEQSRAKGEMADYVSAVLPRLLGREVPDVVDRSDEAAADPVPAASDECERLAAAWAAEAMFPTRPSPQPIPPPPAPPPSSDKAEPTMEQITASIARITETRDAAAVTATADTSAGKREPSMDEILGGIRRLIKADGPTSPSAPTASAGASSASAQQLEINALRQKVAFLEGRIDEQSRLLQTVLKNLCNSS